jgi:opacity protein-like surface antigen
MKITTATIVALTLIGVCFVFISPAFSEESEYARSGGYVGISAIGGSYTRIGSARTSPEADATAGVKVYGGYRINPAFALEIDVEWLAKSDIDTNGINGAAEIESWVATANTKIFWMHDRIQPYTLMGMGMMGATVDDSAAFSVNDPDNGFAFRFGAGLDYYITRNIVASAGVNYILPASQELEDLDIVTYGAGVGYRF